jgi:nitrogenase-stabilizing/protective protein
MEKDPLKGFERLVNAEDYLGFFNIAYDPQVVHVNRLHILKKFSLLKEEIDRMEGNREPQARLCLYKEAMQKAYETFLTSTAPQQRLFKVFQQLPPGLVMVKLDLPSLQK